MWSTVGPRGHSQLGDRISSGSVRFCQFGSVRCENKSWGHDTNPIRALWNGISRIVSYRICSVSYSYIVQYIYRIALRRIVSSHRTVRLCCPRACRCPSSSKPFVHYRIALYHIVSYCIESCRIVSYRTDCLVSYCTCAFMLSVCLQVPQLLKTLCPLSHRIVSYRILLYRIVPHRFVSHRLSRIVLYMCVYAVRVPAGAPAPQNPLSIIASHCIISYLIVSNRAASFRIAPIVSYRTVHVRLCCPRACSCPSSSKPFVHYRIALYHIVSYCIESCRIVSYRTDCLVSYCTCAFMLSACLQLSQLLKTLCPLSHRIVSYRILLYRIVPHRFVSHRLSRIVLYMCVYAVRVPAVVPAPQNPLSIIASHCIISYLIVSNRAASFRIAPIVSYRTVHVRLCCPCACSCPSSSKPFVHYRIALYHIVSYCIESCRIVSYRTDCLVSYCTCAFMLSVCLQVPQLLKTLCPLSHRIVSYRILLYRIVPHRFVSHRLSRIVLYMCVYAVRVPAVVPAPQNPYALIASH